MTPGVNNLLKKVAAYKPSEDVELVRRSFEFAAEAHSGQKRVSGDPYIVHPVATAEILADMHMPTSIVVAGLLHDVPEDTDRTLDDVREAFGEDVASMVGGITKLGKIKYRGIDRYSENLRKMFIAMASDVRVILIKFADRIHNLQTLSALPPHKQKRIALESLEIYSPIANRLGMNIMKSRMEDLAFAKAMPKEYEWLLALSQKAIKVKRGYIDNVRQIVQQELTQAGIPTVEIHGRVKHLYSLYKKLLRHDRDMVQVHDLIALRIIVPSVADCYAALGIIHQRWRPYKGRIKDYISQPKPNGYQSLHTTVFCEGGEVAEFQIRTEQMHQEAERGIAAHWKYDEGGKRATPAMKKEYTWVNELASLKTDRDNTDSFLAALEKLKIEVFQNRIFVFTPNGDVIDLPEGATPVDFAYAIHTQIGDSCVGARINDQIVSLDSPLSSGDCCAIIVDKNRKGPNPDWLKFVKTSGARSKIKSRTRHKLNKWIQELEGGKDDRSKRS